MARVDQCRRSHSGLWASRAPHGAQRAEVGEAAHTGQHRPAGLCRGGWSARARGMGGTRRAIAAVEPGRHAARGWCARSGSHLGRPSPRTEPRRSDHHREEDLHRGLGGLLAWHAAGGAAGTWAACAFSTSPKRDAELVALHEGDDEGGQLRHVGAFAQRARASRRGTPSSISRSSRCSSLLSGPDELSTTTSNACSKPRPASTVSASRSSASGSARPISRCRRSARAAEQDVRDEGRCDAEQDSPDGCRQRSRRPAGRGADRGGRRLPCTTAGAPRSA